MMAEDLWLAGMETTATTLKWALCLMLNYPDVQTKVRSEIHNVLGNTDVTMADRQRLPYTAATVTEIQRCANILPINLMHTTTQDVTIAGYRIPAKTVVVPQIASVLSNDKIFNNAAEFRPERFLSKDGQTLDKDMVDNVIAFSLGKRQCLGESLARMELFMIFATLMQKFEFRVPSGKEKPSLKPIFAATAMTQPYECVIVKQNL